MLPWQVSILRSQLNSKNAEVEMERLTRAQVLESQAQEHREKLKELQRELEHTKTQLEFKVSIMPQLVIWSCMAKSH
jgi:phytoene/squalene synthetase